MKPSSITRAPPRRHNQHTKPVRRTGSSPDVIISTGVDGTIRVWDAATGRAVGPPLATHHAGFQCVALGRVGSEEIVVSGGRESSLRPASIKVFAAGSRSLLQSLFLTETPASVAVTPSGGIATAVGSAVAFFDFDCEHRTGAPGLRAGHCEAVSTRSSRSTGTNNRLVGIEGLDADAILPKALLSQAESPD